MKCETRKFEMAVLLEKQGLLCDNYKFSPLKKKKKLQLVTSIGWLID